MTNLCDLSVFHYVRVGIIEREGTAQGGTAKMRLWTRVRCNGAFGARAQGFLYSSTIEGTLIRINARLHCVWKRFPKSTPPPRGTPLTITPEEGV